GYQNKYGEDIMPSDRHVKAEMLYNKYNIFENLFGLYLLLGVFLFLFVILEIFYQRKWIYNMITLGKWLTFLLVIIHTVGLAARWYISGHAPWSDAYESMVFVAWATAISGLIFSNKSNLTLASTAFV